MATLFPSWSAYYAALTESLSTEYYGETYPAYEKQIEAGKTDMDIIRELLDAGLNAQDGLDGFLRALLDGSRYAEDMSDISDILEMFVAEGAHPSDCLFAINGDSFEDEIQSYTIRGILIDELSELGVPVVYPYDWASIRATAWEDIDEEVIEADYQKACFMYLKYCSHYLQTVA